MTRGEDLLDRHLDDLLAGAPEGHGSVAADIDPELVRSARVVSLALARFHPSFRFEERLAARLRAAALATQDDVERVEVESARPGGPGVVIPFAAPGRLPRTRSRRVNGALIGGAISAGVSIASIAAGLVARRRGRGDGRWERVI
jgi:hypothetical protein